MNLSQLPAAPAPPGQWNDFKSHDNHIVGSYVLQAIVLFITTVAVFIRLYTRKYIKRYLGIDDLFIVISWLFCITFSGLLIADHTKGYGNHVWNLRAVELYDIGKLQFIDEMIYILMLIAIKTAILLSYQRIFGISRAGRWLMWVGIALVTIFYALCLFLSLFSCQPMAKVWDPMVEGHCAAYDIHVVPGTGSGVFNVLTDVYILVIPMPFIWKLKMRRDRKVRVMAVFGLGLLTCIFSIVRLVVTVRYIDDPDFMYYSVKYMAFVVLESNIGLFCGCALVFPAFFDPGIPGSFGSYIAKLHSAHTQQSCATAESGSETELRSKNTFTSLHSVPESSV